MLSGSMPKLFTAAVLVDTATKWLRQVGFGSVLQEPGARAARVHHGFQRGEGLGGNDEQRRGRIDLRQRCARSWPSTFETKCSARRGCASGRSAWQTIFGPRSEPPMPMLHDVGDRPAVIAEPVAVAHLGGKGVQAFQHRVDLGAEITPIQLDDGVARRPERRVQHCPALGGIDVGAGKHGIAPRLDAACARQRQQQRQRLRHRAGSLNNPETGRPPPARSA